MNYIRTCTVRDCNILRVDGKYQCDNHIQLALQLNKKYQRLKPKLDRILSQKPNQLDDPTLLLRSYYTIYQSYNARLEHINYSFSPELQDNGHLKYLDFLETQLQIYEDRLTEFFSESTKDDRNRERDQEKSTQEIVDLLEKESKGIITDRQFKKHNVDEIRRIREENRAETEALLDKFIKENDENKRRVDKLYNYYVSIIVKRFIMGKNFIPAGKEYVVLGFIYQFIAKFPFALELNVRLNYYNPSEDRLYINRLTFNISDIQDNDAYLGIVKLSSNKYDMEMFFNKLDTVDEYFTNRINSCLSNHFSDNSYDLVAAMYYDCNNEAKLIIDVFKSKIDARAASVKYIKLLYPDHQSAEFKFKRRYGRYKVY